MTVWPTNDVDYDTDDDGLIEIRTLAQLDAVRHDLNGDGVVDGQDGAIGRNVGDVAAYEAAFPKAVESMGCGHIDGCTGYELAADLDFDTNRNKAADAGDAYWNGGTGWVPIGGEGSTNQLRTSPFQATFEGNGHSIANLFIDTEDRPFAALFGFAMDERTSRCIIRNVGLVNVDLFGDNFVAGLIAINWGCSVTGSHATGHVRGNMYVAGLVAQNMDTITRSYAGVHATGISAVAGLVGSNSPSGIIAACYATGRVRGVEVVAGMVGYNHGAVTASYSTGRVRGQEQSGGGLSGTSSGLVTASYWDTNASGIQFSSTGRGLTTSQLQRPTRYSGVYRTWNLDLDGDGLGDDPWDFGTSAQYPLLIADLDGDGQATWQELGPQPRHGPEMTSSIVKGLAVTSSSGPDATYVAGDAIDVRVTFNRNMIVTGTPRLTINVGERDRLASYAGGSRAWLKFSYAVMEGDADYDGVSIEFNSLSLEGGTIRDASGNDAMLNHEPLESDPDHKVDTLPPVFRVAMVAGRELTLDFDEALDESSAPLAAAFTVMGGDTARTVTETDVDRRRVTLTVDPVVARYETGFTVSYAVPSLNPIRDLAGNVAEALFDAPVNPPDEGETGGAVLDFAHFANGSSGGGPSITSDMVLVNVSPYSIRPLVYFFDPAGDVIETETVVDVTGGLAVAEDGGLTVEAAIPILGELTISTHGRGKLRTGSVKVFTDGPAGGVLRFDLPYVGVAGVGPSRPVHDAVFPVRRVESGINTGAAIRNLGDGPMTVTCHLMQEGEELASLRFPLPNRGQKARFIDDPDLFGSWFQDTRTSDFTGSIRCTAPEGGAFAGVALEMDAENHIFTTLPVLAVDESAQGREATLDFAHFANGSAIASDLVLINVSTTALVPTITFHDSQGGRIDAGAVVEETGSLEVLDDGSLTVWVEIEPLGELTISTTGRGELTTGSVRVEAEGPIGGVLRFNVPSVGVAGVGASEPFEAVVFPARRQEGGINTGAAIRNLEAEVLTIGCLLMQNGQVLEQTRIDLQPRGQTARFIDEPDLFGNWFEVTGTTHFSGSVYCAAPNGGTFTGVALEMDPERRIFTTLPVIDASTAW